jgi:septal ring factor EnvC (AmiA/AmiB activator)
MSIAFSSSLFGLAGSLVLGFLELQASHAQNRFYNDLEEWLSSYTRLSSGSGLAEGDQSVPAYVQALLEQTADSLESLQRTIARSEEGRGSAQHTLMALADKLSILTDQMKAEQGLMVKLAENQMEIRPVLQNLNNHLEGQELGLDEASRSHLRNLDVYVMRLLEEMSQGRNQTVAELRSEIKLLARTIAALADDR